MDGRALLALLFTVVVWGLGPVFIRTLSVELGPADHLVIRYTLVTIAYLAGLAVMGGWRIERRDWPRLVLISIVGLAGYNLGAAFGFELVPAGIGSLIFGTEPLLIALLAAMVAREKLSAETLIGLAIAFAGTILLIWGDLGFTSGGKDFLRGCAFVFLSVVAFSVYVVASKPLVQKYGSYSIAAIATSLATAVMLVLLARPTAMDTVAAMSPRNWFDMAYVVILSTFISTLTWNYGASRLPAATSGAFFYFMPVIGVIAGAILLGEAITSAMLIGGGLILLGVGLVQFGPRMRGTQLEQPDR
ncbi:MAG: DMT family transporter [Rhizobiales bacterium]|nr:DMT family transporter [Hyphomicrobiales bacterium]